MLIVILINKRILEALWLTSRNLINISANVIGIWVGRTLPYNIPFDANDEPSYLFCTQKKVRPGHDFEEKRLHKRKEEIIMW